ncbi:hypothetical protein HNQ07_003572 [Deinococcus metalli]|uniref:HTH HARE-type domain-containing protein n=1 Tax=Deinococcus metalli TaxID=1141878 RepID=A0A7W8KH37_9DEIO|nr:hypothetical protein [Deinococcus metalli]MBB5378071.1 hypothetical protein [Deinococcus metalli]GHF54205.1 hypothetical protein GCM10017781_33120 [Deinococcus metalli]
MTCRDDILEVIRELVQGRTDQTFGAADVVAGMKARGHQYKELSIRTYVTSTLCAPAPDPTGRRTQDLERVTRGRYRLRDV